MTVETTMQRRRRGRQAAMRRCCRLLKLPHLMARYATHTHIPYIRVSTLTLQCVLRGHAGGAGRGGNVTKTLQLSRQSASCRVRNYDAAAPHTHTHLQHNVLLRQCQSHLGI